MHVRLVGLTLASMLMAGCGQSSDTPGTPGTQDRSRTIENWQIDETLASNLAPRCTYIGYSMQPVRGFSSTMARTSGQSQIKGWSGKKRDGVSASMTLNVLVPPADDVPTLKKAMRKFLDGVKKRRSGWTESESTFGKIGDVVFAKCSWTGMANEHNVEMKGFMLVGIDDGKLIVFNIQDAAGAGDDDYALAQASAQTFRIEAAPESKE